MVEVISILDADFRLYGWNGHPQQQVPPDDQAVAPGEYVILRLGKLLSTPVLIRNLIALLDGSPLPVVLTDESTLRRILSGSSTPRVRIVPTPIIMEI